jgi:hypothetical protein
MFENPREFLSCSLSLILRVISRYVVRSIEEKKQKNCLFNRKQGHLKLYRHIYLKKERLWELIYFAIRVCFLHPLCFFFVRKCQVYKNRVNLLGKNMFILTEVCTDRGKKKGNNDNNIVCWWLSFLLLILHYFLIKKFKYLCKNKWVIEEANLSCLKFFWPFSFHIIRHDVLSLSS